MSRIPLFLLLSVLNSMCALLCFQLTAIDNPTRQIIENAIKDNQEEINKELKKKELEERAKEQEIKRKENERQEYVKAAQSVKNSKPLQYDDLLKKAAQVDQQISYLQNDRQELAVERAQLEKKYQVTQMQVDSLYESTPLEATFNNAQKNLKAEIVQAPADQAKRLINNELQALQKEPYYDQLPKLQGILESLTTRLIGMGERVNPMQDEIDYIGQRVADIKDYQKNKQSGVSNSLETKFDLKNSIKQDQVQKLREFTSGTLESLAQGLNDKNGKSVQSAVTDMEHIKAALEHYKLSDREYQLALNLNEFIKVFRPLVQEMSAAEVALSKITSGEIKPQQTPELLALDDAPLIEGVQAQALRAMSDYRQDPAAYDKALGANPELKKIGQKAIDDLNNEIKKIATAPVDISSQVTEIINRQEKKSLQSALTQIESAQIQLDKQSSFASANESAASLNQEQTAELTSVFESIRQFFLDLANYLQRSFAKVQPTIEQANERYKKAHANFLVNALAFPEGQLPNEREINDRLSSALASSASGREQVIQAQKEFSTALSDVQKAYKDVADQLALSQEMLKAIADFYGKNLSTLFRQSLSDNTALIDTIRTLEDVRMGQKMFADKAQGGLSSLRVRLSTLKGTPVEKMSNQQINNLSRILAESRVDDIAKSYDQAKKIKTVLENKKQEIENRR